MKPTLKFSGVKAEFADANNAAVKDWSFEFRPGGWVIATREQNGRTERRRFAYSRIKDRFFAKFVDPTSSGRGPGAADFYGQKVEASRGSAQGGGANDFTAQFPGKVRKLLVQEGAQVDAGTPLLMVEAMKMEFAIKSETAGKVKKILVQEGQQLTPGQKLLDFEAAGEGAKK